MSSMRSSSTKDGKLILNAKSSTQATQSTLVNPKQRASSAARPKGGGLLLSAEVERLRAANTRQKSRGLFHTSTTEVDEKGDHEVLDLQKLVFKRVEEQNSTLVQPKRLLPISNVKGVSEALDVARIVLQESQKERSIDGNSRKFTNILRSVENEKTSDINDSMPSLCASTVITPSHQGENSAGDSTINAKPLTYYERVIADAPDAEKMTELLTTALEYRHDKYKSGSPMVDNCREELDRFLALESAASGSKVPVSADARLATLFPNQSRQWAEVLGKAKAEGHLSRVAPDAEEDGNEEAHSKITHSKLSNSSFMAEVNKNIQGEMEDKISSSAIERYVARTDIDPAFKRVEPHRLMHLQKNVLTLSNKELDAFADTTQLLQSKGEVQRLLQGVNQSNRQMELSEMRAWTEEILHKNALGKIFDEQLEKQRAGPDGCIGLGQLKQCLSAAQVQPGPKAMRQFLERVDPQATGRLKVTAIREAWSDGELRLGLEPIDLSEARACLDLVIPAARQALGVHLTAHHLTQWMSRLGTSIDMEDAEAFIAKHHPLTCERAFDRDVFREIQGLWVRAKSRNTDTVSEVGLHQRLRDLEIGTSAWDIALDDLERHTSAMQSGFSALQSLQTEMDRQAKKVRLLAQLMPARYTRTVAINTDITYTPDEEDDSDNESFRKRGHLPPWNNRRASTASSTTAPGTSPRGGSPFGRDAARRMSMGLGVGANAVIARDRLVEDLQDQVKHKNEELVRVRVLFEGYKSKAESAIRSANMQLKVKDAELQQLTERIQSYELIDDAVNGAGNTNSAEERLHELQSHFLKKMRESETNHQEEIRNFVREIQTARNTFEEQKHALIAALNEEKDSNQKLMEKIQTMELEVNTRDEAINANENNAQNLAMNLRLVKIQLEEAITDAKNSRDRATMFEEQLALARKTQQSYVSREEMNRRIREAEANFQLKMGNEATTREKLQEELKVTKDKLHAAGMNEIELKASAEKRLNAFRIDLEKMSTHRRQLLNLVRQVIGQWFESVAKMRKGFATEVVFIADLFPWVNIASTALLQTVTEAAQMASAFVTEIAQGAETNDELLAIVREARKENGRAFAPPKDNVTAERDAMAEQLAQAINELSTNVSATKQVTQMLAVSKCAVSNLEDTVAAVTDAIAAAAKGDDRAINRYNLAGPGAAAVSDEKLSDALKAFVPRRMPTSIENAIQAVGGIDGLKNKMQLPTSPPNAELKISFATKLANKKADKQQDNAGVNKAQLPMPKVPVLSYDPLMALQTQSQSLHTLQMGIFSALGQLAGRFTVLTTAVEQSAAQSASATQAAASARAALQKQLDKTKYLDESDDELDVLIKAKRAKGFSKIPTVDEGHSASKASASVASLLWGARSVVSAIATNAVRPTLNKAKLLCTEINDKVSLKQIAEAETRLARSREPYIKLLLKYLFVVRGAQRRVKKANKAFTDAMFESSDSSAPPAKRSSVVPFEELKARVVRAKEELDTIILDASREIMPHIDRFQTYLWQTLQVGERLVVKAQSAIEAATAAAAEDASAAASSKHRPIRKAGTGASPPKGKGTSSRVGTGMTPSLQHLGAKPQNSPPLKSQTAKSKPPPKDPTASRLSTHSDKAKQFANALSELSAVDDPPSPFADVISGAVSRTHSGGFNESFRAFAFDGGQTFISEHTSGTSSTSDEDETLSSATSDTYDDNENDLAMTGTISLGLSRRDEPSGKHVREVGTQATLTISANKGKELLVRKSNNDRLANSLSKTKQQSHQRLSETKDGGSSQASKGAGGLKSTVSQPHSLTGKGKQPKHIPAKEPSSLTGASGSKSTTPRSHNPTKSPTSHAHLPIAGPSTSTVGKIHGARSQSTQRIDTKAKPGKDEVEKEKEAEKDHKVALKAKLDKYETQITELKAANKELEDQVKHLKVSIKASAGNMVLPKEQPKSNLSAAHAVEKDRGNLATHDSPRAHGRESSKLDFIKSTSSASSSAPRAKQVPGAVSPTQSREGSPGHEPLAPEDLVTKPSDTSLPDVRFRENRVSSGSRVRPLPRPMSGNASNAARTQRPLQREDSDPDLAVVRPTSASLNGSRAGPLTIKEPQILPRYLRPSVESVSTQTDLRDIANASSAALIAHLQKPLTLAEVPIGQRIRTWEETQADLRAQEAESMRRMGKVIYTHITGLKAVSPPTIPSIHIEPPPSKALCGLKYKDIIIEDESFESKAPQSTVTMDVIFSSLPSECRIVAAKYCILAMFGGLHCPLAASQEAFIHHLTAYHFAPHSHIPAPQNERDMAVLKELHSDLVAIGAALLSGDFGRYRRRAHPPVNTSSVRAVSPTHPAGVIANVSNWIDLETLEMPVVPNFIDYTTAPRGRRVDRPYTSFAQQTSTAIASVAVQEPSLTLCRDEALEGLALGKPFKPRAQSAQGSVPYRVQPLPTPSSVPSGHDPFPVQLEVVPLANREKNSANGGRLPPKNTQSQSRGIALLSALPKPSTPSIQASRSAPLPGLDSPSPILASPDSSLIGPPNPDESAGSTDNPVSPYAKVTGERRRALSTSKPTKASAAIERALSANRHASVSFPLTIGRIIKEGDGSPSRPIKPVVAKDTTSQ